MCSTTIFPPNKNPNVLLQVYRAHQLHQDRSPILVTWLNQVRAILLLSLAARFSERKLLPLSGFGLLGQTPSSLFSSSCSSLSRFLSTNTLLGKVNVCKETLFQHFASFLITLFSSESSRLYFNRLVCGPPPCSCSCLCHHLCCMVHRGGEEEGDKWMKTNQTYKKDLGVKVEKAFDGSFVVRNQSWCRRCSRPCSTGECQSAVIYFLLENI